MQHDFKPHPLASPQPGLRFISLLLRISLWAWLCGVGLCVSDCYADGSESNTGPIPSQNYEKDSQYLPGEEVVTPTGRKMRVWSTKGPVPVSQAPEPFERESEKSLQGVPVYVDQNGGHRRHENDRRQVEGNASSENRSGNDSFDLRR